MLLNFLDETGLRLPGELEKPILGEILIKPLVKQCA
jgi:hypothetical protein